MNIRHPRHRDRTPQLGSDGENRRTSMTFAKFFRKVKGNPLQMNVGPYRFLSIVFRDNAEGIVVYFQIVVVILQFSVVSRIRHAYGRLARPENYGVANNIVRLAAQFTVRYENIEESIVSTTSMYQKC